jgi:UDP-4-amino-4,6-dideoxy-N-acetyl-beta-L-altrosamine N-acetyltransferase
MVEQDLDVVLALRNHPEVRRYMLTQREITIDEHRDWFDRASRSKKHATLVMEENGQPVGCVVFTDALPHSTSDWSFYVAPGKPPGTGTRLCSAALDFAFNELHLHKVAGRVLDFNGASIRIHRRLGFTHEGTLREHCRVNQTHHNLLCFGVLSSEWCTRNGVGPIM